MSFFSLSLCLSLCQRSTASSPFELQSRPRRRQLFSRHRYPLCCRIMGRKAGGLFINPKKFGTLHKPCMKEMIMFLNCMTSSHNNSEAIARQKELLSACMESQSKKNRKSWGSINYQLQRLSRGRK